MLLLSWLLLCASSEWWLVVLVTLVSVFIGVRLRRSKKRAILQFTLTTAWWQQLPWASYTDKRMQLSPLLRYCSPYPLYILVYIKFFFVYLCGIYTFLYSEKKFERWIMLYLLSGVCPEGMMYLTAAECEVHGGACPRVCLDMTPADVQCATTCYDGCYCAPGFYLLNGSCVPLARCPCYHQGETHPAGATLQVDACNNWYSQYLSFPLIICG